MNHLELTAKLWSAYTGYEISAKDVSAMLILKKLAYSKTDRETEEQSLDDLIESTDFGDKAFTD